MPGGGNPVLGTQPAAMSPVRRPAGPRPAPMRPGRVDRHAMPTDRRRALPQDACSLSGAGPVTASPAAAPGRAGIRAVSTRRTRTPAAPTPHSSTTVTRHAVMDTPTGAEGRRRPATRRASERASPSAAARARGLRRTSTSRSAATSPAGLATVANAATRRRATGVADRANSRTPLEPPSPWAIGSSSNVARHRQPVAAQLWPASRNASTTPNSSDAGGPADQDPGNPWGSCAPERSPHEWPAPCRGRPARNHAPTPHSTATTTAAVARRTW